MNYLITGTGDLSKPGRICDLYYSAVIRNEARLFQCARRDRKNRAGRAKNVAHMKHLLDAIPGIGTEVSVGYSQSMAAVREVPAREREKELSR